MNPDPARQLADIGRRVLRISRPPVALPGSYRLPDAYESLLLDPVAALSDVCNRLLERQPTAPVVRERGGSAGEPEGRRLLSDTILRRESLAAARPDTPNLGGPSPFEQIRRATEAPLVPFLDEPGRALGLPETPAETHPGTPVSRAHDPARPSDRARRTAGSASPGSRDRLDGYAGVRRTAGHGPPPHSAPSPVEQLPADGLDGGPSPEDLSEARRLARRERPGEGRPFPVGDRPADTERLADAGPISRTVREGPASAAPGAEGTLAAGETRLATSASRLAAMLRADAAATGVEEDLPEVAQDGAAFPVRSKEGRADDPVDEEDRARLDSRIDVEEIMERLADELEIGFVRTYGSSGG